MTNVTIYLITHLTRLVIEYKEITESFYHIETLLFERIFIYLYSSRHLKRIKNHQVTVIQRIRSSLRILHYYLFPALSTIAFDINTSKLKFNYLIR